MRLLLLDTCGESASIALAENSEVLRTRTLLPRAASAQLIGTIQAELEVLEWPLRSLHGIGVVNGPGSFTGVRVGLAAAKGLCEVSALKLAAVSRLAVLADAGGNGPDDLAVLDAGRGEFYVRFEQSEALVTHAELTELMKLRRTKRVLVAEEKLREPLVAFGPVLIDLSAASAMRLVQERLAAGGDPVDGADANYVRSARALYASKASSSAPEGSS